VSKLAVTVVVNGKVYEAGSEPPADVAKQITNPDAWTAPAGPGEVGHTGDDVPFRSDFDGGPKARRASS
jgi:hypothetical protein